MAGQTKNKLDPDLRVRTDSTLLEQGSLVPCCSGFWVQPAVSIYSDRIMSPRKFRYEVEAGNIGINVRVAAPAHSSASPRLSQTGPSRRSEHCCRNHETKLNSV